MTENSFKKLDFYKNGKIYRIVCNEMGLQYIGSTCKTLKQRLQQHKASCKLYKAGKGNYITSFKVLENNNCAIVLIEDFPCDRKEQLNARERFYIESMTCVNKCSPNKRIEMGETEYYNQYNKQYYIDNKAELSEKKKEKLPCPHCGCNYMRVNKSKHEKTKKHKKNSSSDSESIISDITI